MGPSPFSDGRWMVVFSLFLGAMLQWGHRLSAMEGSQPGTEWASEANGLQWGHRLSAMEGLVVFLLLRWLRLLQWGHRLSAMEGPQLRIQRRDVGMASMGPSPFSDGRFFGPMATPCLYHSFNGAIAFQRWKGVLTSLNVPACILCFNGAIAFQRWKVGGARFRVRRFRRFNGAIAFQRWKGGTPTMRRCGSTSLQWGHRLSAMEGGLGWRLGARTRKASMGPSPFSDGRP